MPTTPTTTPEPTREQTSIARNRRTDAMFVAAYIAIALLVWIVVYEDRIGEFAQGIVATVLGMFVNELKNMYSFETGTTRSNQAKDATIQGLANAAVTSSSTPQTPKATP